ncbi:type II secretion system protein N [Wenzhouxiangella sp. AB-CW3]|uniref:type II secretion system protein N n=1 Tax=Wenzhouxiangella sp. AB-CW3 TaxID=2771012 RepID=UPI00168B0159|nr:type II secretion system protein N [Wenzhouxiangella sp. AB-CW3]QOC23142.1 type II secretion system protein N [Wenzhouxiangella sp. AB-CW3]
MRKLVWLVLLALPLIIAATLPARVVTHWVDLPDGVEQVRGTVWNGQAQWRQPGHAPMRVQWRWDKGWHWGWQASGDATRLQGYWRPGGDGLSLSEVSGQLGLDRVDLVHWLMYVRPGGYIDVDLDRLSLAPGQVPEIVGELVWREARLEGAVHEDLGEVGLQLRREGESQQIRVESLRPASVHVQGRIDLDASHYDVDIWLRASVDRPDLVSQLARLGEKQPDGQVRVQLRGRLGW